MGLPGAFECRKSGTFSTGDRAALCARHRKVRSAPVPPDGETSARSLASPLPTQTTSLGLRGGPIWRLCGRCDAHSARSMFCQVHAPAEHDFMLFAACGRRTLRGCFDTLSSRRSVGLPGAFGYLALRTCCGSPGGRSRPPERCSGRRETPCCPDSGLPTVRRPGTPGPAR